MPHNQKRGDSKQQRWIEKSNTNRSSASSHAMEEGVSAVAADDVTNRLGDVAINESRGEINQNPMHDLLKNFTVDNYTYSLAQVRAVFYPNFENEKSDQEVRTRMIEIVSKGLATVEASLKHSGSLFMYAGHKGGAYAKNSDGNICLGVHNMTSSGWRNCCKRTELSKMLDEWAVYIRREYEHKQLSSSIYLSKAEPFLEEYAKRSPENQALIGYAGNMIRAEDFLAILERGRDEESALDKERDVAPSIPSPSVKDTVHKDEGLIIFFPEIPGCAKSALCKEILNASGCLEDDRPVHSLMGDLIKGRYWFKVSEERRKNLIPLYLLTRMHQM